MNIFFIGVFSKSSTNYSQAIILEKSGIKVYRYEYRYAAKLFGVKERDLQMIAQVKSLKPDLVLISKGSSISGTAVRLMREICPVVLWFMDAPIAGNWTINLEEKIKEASIVFCEKPQAVRKAKAINPLSFQAIDGFDPFVDKPASYTGRVLQDVDVSFIGSSYGKRKLLVQEAGAQILKGYREEHAANVSRSKINLNFCTAETASNRIYKVMAAGGFLLTDDWEGRQFEDKEDLVIFNGVKDMKEKIKYYLHHDDERAYIASCGYIAVQKWNRFGWWNTIATQLHYNNILNSVSN